MIVDFDDFHETNHRLDLIERLHEINPLFRCTLFAVPGLGSDAFWDSVPPYCELALHGWMHGGPECNDAHECASWTYDRMVEAIFTAPARFVMGFKAPGWQISQECYEALGDHLWWVADQHLEDGRRPPGLRTYFYEDGEDRFHGHIGWNGSGNDLAANFDAIAARVRAADHFQFCSEALVTEWT